MATDPVPGVGVITGTTAADVTMMVVVMVTAL
jgi:hypothetical protein